ncbi:MAG: extracellular solute-binding protein [Eubacteriales bacterium]|nr:extracellular solute-binding protein [Eubacteriales bacterium]MDD3882039.1 extracellular solute-binding protein [Eubacteriales bacterium]MDD4512486.1 extracellular solute-binding protein [Eubacteriales bacterium]
MMATKATRLAKFTALILALAILLAGLSGCADAGYKKNASLSASEPVTLLIAGRNKDFRAIEYVAQEFSKLYPNVKVEYEWLQAFDESLPKRLQSQDDRVDMFITPNLLSDSPYIGDVLDLAEYKDKLDFSDTFPGLTDNFKLVGQDGVVHQYLAPMGGEMRGLYVNKTLLGSLGIKTPETKDELLSACEKLKNAGYIALQDNPGSFAQRLMFPYIVHTIASADKESGVREAFESASPAAAEILKSAMEFIYNLNKEYYYNYKVCETEYNHFKDLTDEGMARSFFNIAEAESGYVKLDDVGNVPFMTSASTISYAMEKVKEDYHSAIEYEFILAPVADYGGVAYMNPTNGIAVNKNSFNIDWTLEFLNFFYSAKANTQFAENYNCAPNTKNALEILSKRFRIPVSQINQPSDIEFSYNLFNTVNPSLVAVSKANNPKYMKDDGAGGIVMYDLEYYMDSLRAAFEEQRALSESVEK